MPVTIEFVEIPEEVLIQICKALPASDLASLFQCHSRLKRLSEFEQLWKFLCKRDYDIDSACVWYGWTYKEFYTRVLHRLRYFLGLWRRKLDCYGGLIKIEVNKCGVSAYDCLPPLDKSFKAVNTISDKIKFVKESNESEVEKLHLLRYRLIFSFKPVGKDVHCFCYQSILGHLDRIGHSPLMSSEPSDVDSTVYSGRKKSTLSPPTIESSLLDDADYDDSGSDEEKDLKNKCIVFIKEQGSSESPTVERRPFKFLCQRQVQHDFNFDYWFEIEHGFRSLEPSLTSQIINELYHELPPFSYNTRIQKFETLTKSSFSYELYPLKLQNNNDMKGKAGRLIEPGLYFGAYSSHGWEIIDVRYNDEFTVMEGTKITGDCNVLADKVSFRVYLDKPLFFNKSDQLNVASINEALKRNELAEYKLISQGNSDVQDFEIPEDLSEEVETLPKQCYFRRLGEGQIAYENFESPTFVPIIFSTFGDDFYILWAELSSISVFHRVKNMNERIKN